ncbi:hypothetical protein [Nonomuraea sp. NPDC049646]|uniref:hypothetical protein n=1 Tax=unclassified Nonomuraea TaxID=2593643 RepID=UPI0037ADE1E7
MSVDATGPDLVEAAWRDLRDDGGVHKELADAAYAEPPVIGSGHRGCGPAFAGTPEELAAHEDDARIRSAAEE